MIRKSILIVFLTLSMAEFAISCSCILGSLKNDIDQAEIIFIGTPIARENIYPVPNQPPDFTYLFKIDDILKYNGNGIIDSISVFTEDSGFRCGWPVELDKKHVIFARMSNERNSYMTYCANNNFILNSESNKQLKRLKRRINGELAIGLNFRNIFQIVFAIFLILILRHWMKKH